MNLIRQYVHTVLGAARLPIGAVRLVAGHQKDATWPPVLAFDSFQGGLKSVLGSALSDHVLVEEGRLEQARVSELREAAQLEAEAELLRQRADISFEDRMQADERRRHEAEAAAERRRTAAHESKERGERRAAAEASRARKAAQEAAEHREAQLEDRERAARLETIAEERTAVEREKRAASAAAEVTKVDRKIQTSKAKRATKKSTIGRSTRPSRTTGSPSRRAANGRRPRA